MASHEASVGPWEVVLRDLMTPVGLEIAAVRIWGEGARFQTEPFTYEMDGEAEVEAMIHETQLEAFVRSKVPDKVEEISLKLEPGKLLVTAVVRFILPMTAKAVCTLRVEQGKQIFVDLQSVEMLGAGVKSLVQKQLDAINPVLDADTFPFELVIDGAEIGEGRIVARGSANPPKASPE